MFVIHSHFVTLLFCFAFTQTLTVFCTVRKEFGQLCSDLLKPIRAPPPPAPAVPPVADSPQTGGAVNRHPTAPSGTA
jgi:hypothetical protein